VVLSTPPPNLALKDLALLVGDDATREIVRLFLHSFPDSIRSLGISSRQDQMRITHGLKSSALHMGADKLSEHISVIEDKLAQPGAPLSQDDLKAAIAEFDSFAAELRKYAD
jgi:HPt (histidine-containing phosphotransfer) domain-containing protein